MFAGEKIQQKTLIIGKSEWANSSDGCEIAGSLDENGDWRETRLEGGHTVSRRSGNIHTGAATDWEVLNP